MMSSLNQVFTLAPEYINLYVQTLHEKSFLFLSYTLWFLSIQ